MYLIYVCWADEQNYHISKMICPVCQEKSLKRNLRHVHVGKPSIYK